MITPIPISLRRWGRLISDKDPKFTLISYGLVEGSGFVRKLVTRRKADGVVFAVRCGAIMCEDTDWTNDSPGFVTLTPAVRRTEWDAD
jgi:hypothetical protein